MVIAISASSSVVGDTMISDAVELRFGRPPMGVIRNCSAWPTTVEVADSDDRDDEREVISKSFRSKSVELMWRVYHPTRTRIDGMRTNKPGAVDSLARPHQRRYQLFR